MPADYTKKGSEAEQTLWYNDSNATFDTFTGFRDGNYGTREIRYALALKDAGLAVGGSITAADIQTAVTNALQSQAQVEFSETLLQDANNDIFISVRTVDEETGTIIYSNRTLDGTPFTPVQPVRKPDNTTYSLQSTRYEVENPIAGANVGDIVTKVDTVQSDSSGTQIASTIWRNEMNGAIIPAPAYTDLRLSEDKLIDSLSLLARSLGKYQGSESGLATSVLNINTALQLTKHTHLAFKAGVGDVVSFFYSNNGTTYFPYSTPYLVNDIYGGLGNSVTVASSSNEYAIPINHQYIRLTTNNPATNSLAWRLYSSVDNSQLALIYDKINLLAANSGANSFNLLKGKALVASTGVSIGDVLEVKRSFFNTTLVSETYFNLSTRAAVSYTTSNLRFFDDIEFTSKRIRGVNTNVSIIGGSAIGAGANVVLDSIYVDTLVNTLSFLQIHQTATAPATGAVPLESYRIGGNSSVAIDFEKLALAGPVFVVFSTTAGTYTASTIARNFILKWA